MSGPAEKPAGLIHLTISVTSRVEGVTASWLALKINLLELLNCPLLPFIPPAPSLLLLLLLLLLK